MATDALTAPETPAAPPPPGRSAIASPSVDLESLHRLHSYCARFPSEIAESAILAYTGMGDSIYDAFCGSGTTLTAGLALGRRVVGTDVDYLAGLISTIKVEPVTAAAYAAWRGDFEPCIDAAFDDIVRHWPPDRPPGVGAVLELGDLKLPVPSFPELCYWFPPQLIAFLAAIAAQAHACEEAHFERVALVSLSAAIIAKWPNTLSYAMDVDHTRPHRRRQQFRRNRVRETYRKRLDRTVACLAKFRAAYEAAGIVEHLPGRAQVICPHDARLPAPGLEPESQALVVTSPPYFNAVDYPRAHRLSVCWMNGHAPASLVSRRQYIGVRHVAGVDGEAWFKQRPELAGFVPTPARANGCLPKLAAFFTDLDAALHQIWRALRPGGHAVIVMADNTVKGHRIAAHAALAELARQIGFHEIERRPRTIDAVRRRFPVGPFGFDGPITHEHVVVLRRPPRRVTGESAAAAGPVPPTRPPAPDP